MSDESVNSGKQNTPEDHMVKKEPEDRGIPSVAKQPRAQLFFMAAFGVFALLAIIFVIIDGIQKSKPEALTVPEETVFKTASGTALPYFEDTPQERVALEDKEPAPTPDPAQIRAQQIMQEEAMRMALEEKQKRAQRLRSDQLVYDQSAPAHTSADQNALDLSALEPASGTGRENQLARQIGRSQNKTVHARMLDNLDRLIPQGTIIAGILETAIHSDLPGMIRAVVSQNVYSFDGTKLLIPKGTRLIGRYRAGLVRGQSRVFIIWQRLIRHDGLSITIDSPGTDTLGRAGANGRLDTHFFKRFGSSIMLSLIDAGLQTGVRSIDNELSANVALQTGDDFSKSAQIALENSVAIPPTVHISQGTKVNVFVGKDLDFSVAY